MRPLTVVIDANGVLVDIAQVKAAEMAQFLTEQGHPFSAERVLDVWKNGGRVSLDSLRLDDELRNLWEIREAEYHADKKRCPKPFEGAIEALE